MWMAMLSMVIFQYSANDFNVSTIGLTFGYDGSQAGSTPIGAELNVYYRSINGNDPDPRVSGIVYYDSSYGRFPIGMPSAVADDYIDAPVIGRTNAFSFGSAGNVGDTYISIVSLYSDVNIYGVRFDGSYGDVKYGLSYHAPEDSGGLYAITGAVQHQFMPI